jgi:sigma-B regulation protein RsbU (phosphoserine phosphatase)
MSLEKLSSTLRSHWVHFALALIPIMALYALYGVNIVRWRNSPDFGWRTMFESGPNVVVEAFEAGKAAGLRIGDTIVAINGQAYSTFYELFFKLRHEEPGSVNTYTVKRDGKEIDIRIITGRLGFRTVLWRSGVIYLTGLIYVLIGALVFLMKPRARESWLFLVMTCIIGTMVSQEAPSELIRPLWAYDARKFLEAFTAAPLIHLGVRFPRTYAFILRRPWLLIFPYLLSFILFALTQMTSTAAWNIPPILNGLINAYIMVGVLVFLVSIVRNFLKDPSVLVRLQSQVIFVGIIVGFFVPVTDLLLRSFFKHYLFPDPPVMGFAVCLIMFPLSIGYTIVRYDLFTIDAVIKRTYGYMLTTGAIAGMYALFVFFSNLVFGRFEVARSAMFPLVFVLAVVFLFNPVRNRVQRFIDRVFYRLEYDYEETVERISETMRSLLNLDEIIKTMMDTALGVMFIDSGCLLLLNRKKQAYECLRVAGDRKQGGDRAGAYNTLAADDPLIGKIADRKKEVTIYDIQKDPFFEDERESCKKTFDRMEATLIVPLIYEDGLTGLISLGQKKSGKFYRREDINLLKTLANQGAVAIENAMLLEEVIEKERMEEELAIARDLQTSMLPATCPEIEGFEIAATSIPAREVGGDFFDFIQIGEGRVGVVVADVTGKSVSGALVMSASRSVFRMLSEEELTVGEIMIRANRRTKKDIKSGMFVALLYVVLNSRDRTLSLCSAGQTQPIHVSAETGKARLVETAGDTFPLGILEDAEYQETRLQLARGDRVVLYTDGIVEAMNEQQEIFGFERLLDVIQGTQHVKADKLLRETIDRVNEFVGGAAQHDDLTVIVLSVSE